MRGLCWLIAFLQIIICGWLLYKERSESFDDYGFIPISHVLFNEHRSKSRREVSGFFQGYLVRRSKQLFLVPNERMIGQGTFFHGAATRIWIPSDKFNPLCENSYVVVRGNLHNYSGLLAIDDVLLILSFEEEDLNCYSAENGVVNYYERGFGKNIDTKPES